MSEHKSVGGGNGIWLDIEKFKRGAILLDFQKGETAKNESSLKTHFKEGKIQ